jgi:signal transduction histidine kinase
MALASVNLGPRSVAFRVIAFSTVWAIITLVIIGTVISALYYRSSVRSFRTLLSAHMFNLIGSVSVTDDGALSGNPDLGDLRFSEPNSGWYWSVTPVSDGLHGDLRSLSLMQPIATPRRNVPFDADFRRHYRARGPAGQRLEVLESEVVLDTNNRVARFLVTGNRDELRTEIKQFQHRIFLYLSLFGIGMILINAVAILLGLRPLDRVRQSLQRVREGKSQNLDGDFPAEIAPLALETNALIDNNRRMIERSRLQVGNLAHSLKTPIAVLLNEGRALGGRRGGLIVEQTAAMQQQVEHYLRRARIAAQRDSVVFRTPLIPTLERLVRVMTKLNPGIRIEFHPPEREVVFAGEAEDFEEIAGNLLENAMKWARHAVSVTLRTSSEPAHAPVAILAIEDDGPGIPAERTDEALKRGKRLDETKPGSGLGLSIVSDLVEEYGGTLELGRAELGGLKVVVGLPGV